MRRMETGRNTKCFLVAGALFLATAAVAGPPVPFNAYTVTNGVINAPCPAGATCDPSSVVTSNGFMERQVHMISSGRTYIQFILTDIGTSGDPTAATFSVGRGNIGFTNEDFVQMGNRSQGIASYQSISASQFITPTQEDRFVYTNDYELGWAQLLPPSPTPWVNVHESISTLDYSTNPLNPTEIFNTTADIKSSNTSFSSDQNILITQSIKLGANDAQKLVYNELSGIYLPVGHPGVGPTPLLPGGSSNGLPDSDGNQGNITWSAFSSIPVDALWVGQSMLDTTSPGYQGTVFGYTRYDLDGQVSPPPLDSTSYYTFSDPNPVNWVSPPFVTAPTIAYNVTLSPTYSAPAPSGLTGTGDTGVPATGNPNPLGPPIGFDAYSVASGYITTNPCPLGVDCSLPDNVYSPGIVQRIIKVGSDQYLQTIVTDGSSSGTPGLTPFSAGALKFSEESFVKMGQAADPGESNGIASKLHIEQKDIAYKVLAAATNPLPTGGGLFTYDVALNKGWANGGRPLAPTITVDQKVDVPDNLNDSVSSMYQNFHMKIGTNPNDRDITLVSVTGTDRVGDTITGGGSIPLIFLAPPPNTTCTVGLGGTVNGANCDLPTVTTPGTGFVNPVVFETRIIGGVYQNSSHTGSVLPSVSGPAGDLPWSTGDSIQATWMGARYQTSDGTGYGDASIASTTYTDISTGGRATYTTPQYPRIGATNPNPDSWLSPFNTWTPPVVPSTWTPPTQTWVTPYVPPAPFN